MQGTLTQIVWIILIAVAVLAVGQVIYLLWLHRPSWMFRRRRPAEPIMPSVLPGMGQTSTLAQPYTGAEVRVEGQIATLSGLSRADTIPLPGNQFGIGRFRNEAEKVLVALDERSISRRHAVFHADGIGIYYLTDSHSSYGTFVRKGATFERLPPGQRERIYNHDEIRFGQHVTVRFDLPGDTRSSATQL